MAGAPASVAPQPASVLGRPANAQVRLARPPSAVFDRPVVAKTIPPPAPVPFAARQQVLEQHPGRALDAAEVQNLRPTVVSQPKALIHPPLRTGFVPRKGEFTPT